MLERRAQPRRSHLRPPRFRPAPSTTNLSSGSTKGSAPSAFALTSAQARCARADAAEARAKAEGAPETAAQNQHRTLPGWHARSHRCQRTSPAASAARPGQPAIV